MIASVGLAIVVAGHNALRSADSGAAPSWSELRLREDPTSAPTSAAPTSADPTAAPSPFVPTSAPPREPSNTDWPYHPGGDSPDMEVEPFGGHNITERLQVTDVLMLPQGWYLNGTTPVQDLAAKALAAKAAPVCEHYNQKACTVGFELKCYSDADMDVELTDGNTHDVVHTVAGNRTNGSTDAVEYVANSCPEHIAHRLVAAHGSGCPMDFSPICYYTGVNTSANVAQNTTTQNTTHQEHFHDVSEMINVMRKRSNYTPGVTDLSTTAAPTTEASVDQMVEDSAHVTVDEGHLGYVSKDAPPGAETFSDHSGVDHREYSSLPPGGDLPEDEWKFLKHRHAGSQYLVDGHPDYAPADYLDAPQGVVSAPDPSLEGTNGTAWVGDGNYESHHDTFDAFTRFPSHAPPHDDGQSADGPSADGLMAHALSAQGLNASASLNASVTTAAPT